MKQQPLKWSKPIEQGFTLLEALVGLIMFSIILLGSGMVMNYMLKSQKDMQVNAIVIDQMQARVQGAVGAPSTGASAGICSSIDKSAFMAASKTFYIGCATETIPVNSSTIYWPVLAASSVSQEAANKCADGSALTADCYIVGK